MCTNGKGCCKREGSELPLIVVDVYKRQADSWEEALERRPKAGYPMPGDGKVTLRDKHLAEYNGRFEEDMRRLLKGDEGMLNSLAFHSRRNPAEYGVINYMANTNGMTMMDMVSYDRKPVSYTYLEADRGTGI